MKTKIKPPKETKAELMLLVRRELEAKFEHPTSALEFLLNFFTAADLVEILRELKQ